MPKRINNLAVKQKILKIEQVARGPFRRALEEFVTENMVPGTDATMTCILNPWKWEGNLGDIVDPEVGKAPLLVLTWAAKDMHFFYCGTSSANQAKERIKLQLRSDGGIDTSFRLFEQVGPFTILLEKRTDDSQYPLRISCCVVLGEQAGTILNLRTGEIYSNPSSMLRTIDCFLYEFNDYNIDREVEAWVTRLFLQEGSEEGI